MPAPLLLGLRGVDLILHAGDLTVLSVLDELASIAPVEAVYGNVDGFEVRTALPRTRLLQLSGHLVGLVHGDGFGLSTAARARHSFVGQPVRVVVYGHSHSPRREWHGDVLMFNPGSPTDKRRELLPSFGLLRLGETITGEIVYLQRQSP